MRARSLALAVFALAASASLGCDVPAYEIDDHFGEVGDDSGSDDVSLDSAPTDVADTSDTGVGADVAETSDATVDATDGFVADASDALDVVVDTAPDVDPCDGGCSGGKACCSSGCVDFATDLGNCGSCGKACTPLHAVPQCAASSCGYSACTTGFDDCNKIKSDGCETSLTTVTDCGKCGVACTLPLAATTTCATGTCKVDTCIFGRGDCNGVDGDGCETDTSTSLAHCGSCGSPCTTAHATPICAASTCSVASCDAGFANCDGSATNGCERAMATVTGSCASPTTMTSSSSGLASICSTNGPATETTLTYTGFGTTFYKVTLKRCDAGACKSGNPARAHFTVTSPAAMAFDLSVYDAVACNAAALVGTSTSGVLGGTESVSWTDPTCPSSKDFWLEVKWRRGDGCGQASVTVSHP